MKKITLLLAFALCLVIAGCGKRNESTKDAEESKTVSPTDSTEERTITADDYSYGLTDDGMIKGYTALDGMEYPDWSKTVFYRSELMPAETTVESTIKNYILSGYTTKVTDRPVEDGDLVNIDYSGKLDGVAFAGGTATGQDLTAGSAEFVDNFLTKIIGHEPGETFDIEVTFPDPYLNNTDLSGKLTIFTVTINYISETAALTDEFVKEHSAEIASATGFDAVETAEELRDEFRNYYYEDNLRTKIYSAISEMDLGEVPELVYDYSYHTIDLSVYTAYGMSLEKIAVQSGKDEEWLKDYVNKNARVEMVIQAIAEHEGWQITKEDFHESTKTDDNDTYISSYGLGYLARYVMTDRALAYLKENITIEEAP